MLKAKDIKIKR